MGWLVGLPLGLFRLLGSILLVALRFAVPILILVAVILVVRHVRRRSARYRAEDEDRQEPKFHGPVYTVDYEEVPDSEDPEEGRGQLNGTHQPGGHRPAGPADPQAGLVPPVAVVLLPWAGDAGAYLLPAPADGGDL